MKKELKKDLEAKIADITPVDEAFSELPYEAKKPRMAFGRAGKWAFGGSLVAGVAVLGLTILALAPGADVTFEDESQLSFPTYRSRMEITHDVPAYETFVERFVPVLFESFDRSASVSVSLPDLFVALALSAYLSGGAIESEFLSYVGLENDDELLTSCSDIFRMLGNLDEDGEPPSGGLLLSSLFLDPLYKLRDDEEMGILLEKVADAFGTAIFYRSPSDSVLNAYLRSVAPRGASVPEIDLDDTLDCIVASTYIGNFFYKPEEAFRYKSSYDAGNRMPYRFGEVEKNVPYIGSVLTNSPYLGSLAGSEVPFEGIGLGVGNLANLYCFKTLDEKESPFALISDILGRNYEEKYSAVALDEETFFGYYLTVKVPYFKDETNVNFTSTLLGEMPSFGNEDAFLNKILAPESPKATFKVAAQQLQLNYDYMGFTVASLTYVGGATSTMPSPVKKDLFFDRPFAYVLYESGRHELPIVVGCIVDPAY